MYLGTADGTYVENHGPMNSRYWTADEDDGIIDTRYKT